VQEFQIERGMTLHKAAGANLLAVLDELAQVSFRLAAGEGHLFQNKSQVLDGGPKS
jgi:hypothetical protein